MKKLKVLAIDDEENVLVFFRRLASHEQFEIVTVKDAVQAVKSIQEDAFDLVFLDVTIPHINGIEILKKIKEIRPSIPVYLMTGSEIEQIEKNAILMGASGCLYKPFDFSKLLALIGNAKMRCVG